MTSLLPQNIRSRLRCALAVMAMLFLCLAPALAQQSSAGSSPSDCSQTNPKTCDYVAQGGVLVPVIVGSTLPGSPGNTAAVAAAPVCEAVTNTCSAAIMVPHKFNDEWDSFINNHESCAALADCPILTTLTANPTTVLGGSSTKLTWTVNDPYGLTPTCTATSSDGSWSKASVSASGGSQNVTPVYNSTNHSVISVTYTLNCSDNAQPPHTGTSTTTVTIDPDGACGSDNGNNSLPSLADDDPNLCSSFNNPSTVIPTSTGWTWSCTPNIVGDGDTVPCSGSLQAAECAAGASLDGSGNFTGNPCTHGTPINVDTTTGTYSCQTSSGSVTNTASGCTATTSTIVKYCAISVGCHNTHDGVICPCLCSWYYSSGGSLTPYSPDPVPTGGFTLENQCSLQGQCGTNVTVNASTGATTGTLCDVGDASPVSRTDGSYTCTPSISGISVMGGYQASAASCTATVVCDSGYSWNGSSCVAGTSGSVTVEASWGTIWQQKAPSSFNEFVGIVPGSSCNPGENYTITSVNISVPPGYGVPSAITALANTIQGLTLQCQYVTVQIGVGQYAYSHSEFGLGFFATVYSPDGGAIDPYAKNIGVIKSDGSSAILKPNGLFLYNTTGWSLQ